VASVAHLAPIHLGLDVHRDTISVGVLAPGEELPAVDKIGHDEPSGAGSLAALAIPVGCEPAMRPGRPALSWPGCCTAWGSAAR
jgi:hypothetical protein